MAIVVVASWEYYAVMTLNGHKTHLFHGCDEGH